MSVTKKELITKMKKAGIEEAHEYMTMKELRQIYKDFKKRNKEKVENMKRLEEVQEKREENDKKKKGVKKGKHSFKAPSNYFEIDSDAVSGERVRGDIINVVFKRGLKVQYDIKTGDQMKG